MRSFYLSLAAVIAASALAAQDMNPGRAVFESRCARCHGADGMSHTFEGKMTGAAKFSDPEVVKLADADLIVVVKNGKKKMPAFGKKLTDDQIASVLAYVHTLQKPANPQ